MKNVINSWTVSRDPKVEAFLDSFLDEIDGYELENVSVAEIRPPKESDNLQAREELLTKSHLDSIEIAMLNGLLTTPVILYRWMDRLVTLDGHHRIAVCRRSGVQEIQAYIVNGLHAVASQIARAANIGNGKELSLAEKDNGIIVGLTHGKAQTDVAKEFSVSVSYVSDVYRSNQAILRLRDAGVKDISSVKTRLIPTLRFEADHLSVLGCELQKLTGNEITRIAQSYERVKSSNKEDWCISKNDELSEKSARPVKKYLSKQLREAANLYRHVAYRFSIGSTPQYLSLQQKTSTIRYIPMRIAELKELGVALSDSIKEP